MWDGVPQRALTQRAAEPSAPPHFRPAEPQSVARKTEVGQQLYCHTNAVDIGLAQIQSCFLEVSASETSQ